MTLSLSSIGPYRITRTLGEGGMGAVYEAVHEAIERRVAIKILHPEFARNQEVAGRLFNEARATSRIDHPSMVQIFDLGRLEDGTAFIIMEYLNGETLRARLNRVNELSVAEALHIGWQIATALTAVHRRGIVHRDLKPDNIMLVQDPVAPGGERCKILDFGIAKVTTNVQVDSQGKKTRTDLIMGTPHYMSPEQCRGSGVDAKSDAYSLGVIMFEMLAGLLPFEGQGGETIAMHLYQQPPLLKSVEPDIPESLSTLVSQLLIKDKEQRLDMVQVIEAFDRINSELGFPPLPKLSPKYLTPESPVEASSQLSTTPTPAQWQTTPLSSTGGMRRSQPGAQPGWQARLGLILVAAVSMLVGAGVLALVGMRASSRATSKPLPVKPPQQPEPVTAVAPPPASTPPPAVAAPAAPALETPPAPRTIHWLVLTTPPGAKVISVTGEVLGKTPWKLDRNAEPGTLTVRLQRRGWVDRTLVLRQDNDEIIHEELQLPAKRPRAATGAEQPAGSPPATKAPTKVEYED